MLAACDAILKPNCVHYQVHATAALKIGPGAREQVLHREEDPYQFFKVPRPRMILASMWAMTDFTEANGGTLIVPGSHLWPADRVARRDEVVAAAMPAGSVLLWMGGTLHGAGANLTDEWRYGVFLSYSLGWIRQEENQYVDVPYDIARTLTKEVRDLVGYRMHMGIGYCDGLREKQSQRESLMPKISYRVRPETAVLTRGFDPELSVGSARPPVYRSSTFVFPSPEAAERAFGIVLGKIRPLATIVLT